MKSWVALYMSLKNVGGAAYENEIYSFVEENLEGITTYKLEPRGRAICAASEYIVILGAVGSAASIAALLWMMAYDKFVGGKKASPDDGASLYIGIKDPDGKVYNFYLGNKHKNQDVFIEEFAERVETLQSDKHTEQQTRELQARLKSNTLMERRKWPSTRALIDPFHTVWTRC